MFSCVDVNFLLSMFFPLLGKIGNKYLDELGVKLNVRIIAIIEEVVGVHLFSAALITVWEYGVLIFCIARAILLIFVIRILYLCKKLKSIT